MSQEHERKLIELASLVKTMRQLQTEFFRTGKTASAYERATLVERAKKLEAEVDKAVEKVLNPKPEQAQLF